MDDRVDIKECKKKKKIIITVCLDIRIVGNKIQKKKKKRLSCILA